MNQMQNLDPVVPLQASENRRDIQVDSPELVEHMIARYLLNELTMETFDPISDQIIALVKKHTKEKHGRTLILVIRLVCEKATDEATSEMYAQLCKKMMEQIGTKVQVDHLNSKGKPIRTGDQLFRKYFLDQCQKDFESGWVAKEATAAAAATKAWKDDAAKAANAKIKEGGSEGIVRYSDEYYAAQKAKRQCLGLIKFIGELFKLRMIAERIMHECVIKLLGNVDNPEEEEIESLCTLLATVGNMLDTQKARAHMDVYFSRMKELMKNPNVTYRMQYMVQDLLELRERKWVARNAVAAPTTIAQIHENADRSPESTVQPLCSGPPLNLTSVVIDSLWQKKSDSLATGSGELGEASPSHQSSYGLTRPPSANPSTAPSVISLSSHASGSGRTSRNYEAERLQILLYASQEDLRLQQRQFEEEKILMIRHFEERQQNQRVHFEERQQNQRVQFDDERMLYQSQIETSNGYRSGKSRQHRK